MPPTRFPTGPVTDSRLRGNRSAASALRRLRQTMLCSGLCSQGLAAPAARADPAQGESPLQPHGRRAGRAQAVARGARPSGGLLLPLAGPRRRRAGRRAIADRAAVLHTMENLPEICGDLRLNGFPQCKARREGGLQLDPDEGFGLVSGGGAPKGSPPLPHGRTPRKGRAPCNPMAGGRGGRKRWRGALVLRGVSCSRSPVRAGAAQGGARSRTGPPSFTPWKTYRRFVGISGLTVSHSAKPGGRAGCKGVRLIGFRVTVA